MAGDRPKGIPVGNWWCLDCKAWIASDEVMAGTHTVCKGEAKWRTAYVQPIGGLSDGDTPPIGDPPPPRGGNQV
jgi:hypothetical protein